MAVVNTVTQSKVVICDSCQEVIEPGQLKFQFAHKSRLNLNDYDKVTETYVEDHDFHNHCIHSLGVLDFAKIVGLTLKFSAQE